MSTTRELCIELIRRPSVTPFDAGCQPLLMQRLEKIGFACRQLPFGEVSNLWAERGSDGPLLVFAGHTDVVPPGPLQDWDSDPFEAVQRGEYLYGRGAADMKGGLAAMLVACEEFVAEHPRHRGRIGFLITSDEEGAAQDGTRRVVEWLQQQQKSIDWCLLGEPSSSVHLGDTIRHGRRGSLSAELTVRGRQGHIAYPQLADNPIHRALPALAALCEQHWDDGNEFFPPTALQISNIRAGSGTTNVIPGELQAQFNFRFSSAVSADELQARAREILEKYAPDHELQWQLSGQPFLTDPGTLLAASVAAIGECLGREPELSTAGGTSDGRFIAPLGAQVVELGPVNATIHQCNERIRATDLEALTAVYRRILEKLLID